MDAIRKPVEKMLVLLLAIYIIMLPFMFGMFAGYQVLTFSVIYLSMCVFVSVVCYTGQRVTLTWMDMAVLLLFIYEWLHVAIISDGQVDVLVYYEWMALGMIYLLSRMMAGCSGLLFMLPFAVALSGGLQSLVGFLQYGGALKSSGENFVLTGCFGNPGPLGGYLAVSLVSAIYLLMQKKGLAWRIIGIILSLLVGVMLVCSDSRAGWLAALVPGLYLLYKVRLFDIKNRTSKNVLCTALIILCIIIVAALYQYKKKSADVRLLIWTVGVEMLAEAPLCGHGTGSFAKEYMEYQARYFERHPDSVYASLSDNNTQAFNELLTVLCEQGVIGGLLILFPVGITFFGKKGTFGIRGLLLSLCVFSCFSYPGDIFPLKAFFPLFLGTIPCDRLVGFSVKKKVFALLFLLCLCPLFMLSIRTKNLYETAFIQLERNKPQIILLYNKEYMSRYLQLLLEHKEYGEFVRLATDVSFPFMTSMLKCDIGTCYMRMGEYEKSETALRSAYWMVPSKVLPKYLLFTLYRDARHFEKACDKAKEILSLKVPKVGSIYLAARAEARTFLQSDVCREKRQSEIK
ncbi:O-antigen ligase family protein [Bacteroides ovatus]|mgnify:CR=1 FL=1|jgi:hypothetical protein bacD2_03684|uniref:O-antigen ligase family protein n=1 Tax=Bacteroidales TaxID=171549 RepID=UPI000EDACB36|nr:MULTISPECIES: O-antigen ligase family protein [Bacteroides]MCS2622702.1 O-antigen ligase family protein [Bacteroides xylanisolvens]MCS3023056.1 O-antigen ligase family protein [Bacteroides xylanisolvens]MDC2459763.1 O-antigen ligase family protein [Bacteroides ovatus]RJU31910.1 O-antigen ligase domain-containing protein [Bacteroides sp. AM54-2NS]UVP11062.1 O-antigen ligase family protein [Bacteroides ovatus]